MNEAGNPVEVMNRAIQLGVKVQTATAEHVNDALREHADSMTTAGVATGVLIALVYAFQHVVQVNPEVKAGSAFSMIRVLLDGLEANMEDMDVSQLLIDMTRDASLENRMPEGSA